MACLEAADVDGDHKLTLTDAIQLLSYLFARGPHPQSLFPGCWSESGEGALGCERFEACNPIGVVLVCDRSTSMLGTPWRRVQQEAVKVISRLSEEDEFAVVLFDYKPTLFPRSGGRHKQRAP